MDEVHEALVNVRDIYQVRFRGHMIIIAMMQNHFGVWVMSYRLSPCIGNANHALTSTLAWAEIQKKFLVCIYA